MAVRTTILTWLVRALLLMLVASFALWGIADMFQPNASGNYAAKVDDKIISEQDYKYSLDNARNNLQQMMGESYNPAMLKSLNVEKQVLANLINDTVLLKEAERYGIRIADSEVLEEIRNTPAFMGEKGTFDKAVFEQTLRRAGLNEAMYVAQLKQDKARKLLTETLMQLDLYPHVLPSIQQRAALEKRNVNLWTFNVNRSASASLKPTDEELKGYYNKHASQYAAPEYRSFAVLKLDAEKFAKEVSISDEELRKTYESTKSSFALPEKREVEQLLYNDEASAQKAAARASAGESFAAIAKTLPPSNTEISLGSISHSETLDNAADAVFNAQEHSVTAPIQSPLGWHVFYVKSIDHSRQATFEEVREQMAKDAKQTQAEDALYARIETLENAVMNHTPLEQAAKEAGETVSVIGPVSVNGQLQDGTPVTNAPPIDQWLEQGFGLEANQSTSAIRAEDGNYYMVSPTAIIAPRNKSLDEVRGLVEADWRLATLREKLQAALQDAQNRPQQLADALLALGGSPSAITVSQKSASDLPQPLLLDIFSQPIGGLTSAHTLKNGNVAIASVEKIIAPSEAELEAANNEEVESDLRVAYSNDVYDLFMRDLNKRYKVEINPSIFKEEKQQ